MDEYLVAEVTKFFTSPINQVILYLGIFAIAGTLVVKSIIKVTDIATSLLYAIETKLNRNGNHKK